jgi:hypothetical protein
MEPLTPPERDADARRGLVILLLAVLVLAAVAVTFWLLARRPAEGPKGPPLAPRAHVSPAPRPTPTASGAPGVHLPAEAAETRSPAAAPRLRVDADVPGANVFVDRRFLGTTPVEARDLTPGTHRLNVSAEGYEMYGESIELSSGPRDVMVRFKEVRLDERVAVVHRHGMGSCRGSLIATTAGLRYEADKPADSFEAPLSALEPLQVDYLSRNLRVKVRGGKTYNFTADGADTLLAFQKAVEKARARM